MTEPTSFLSIKWIKPLYQKLIKIWDTRDQELEEIVDIFGDPRLLAKYYIQPDCQQHNPTDYDEDSIRSYVKSEIFKTINNFLGRDAIERDGRNQMFVLADAGMGKTSLFLMLKLSQMFSFWPTNYDCLLLKLGPETLDKISEHKKKSKTVLLLDALDEDPLARGRIADRLQEILEASKNFRHIIISCRTQFFPNSGLDAFGRPGQVVVGSFTCPMIFLSLFDDIQVKNYLIKRFPNPWHHFLTSGVDRRRQQAEVLLKSMHSLQFRPLLLAHIEDLLESEQTDWNSYTIYESLVKTWLRREKRKLDQQNLKVVSDEGELWDACRMVAVYLQSQGTRVLPENELEQLITNLPPVEHLQYMDFGGRSLLNRTSNKEYRFAHYSIQEFFIANATCTNNLKTDLEYCNLPSSSLITLTSQIMNFIRCSDRNWAKHIYTHFNYQELPSDQLLFRDSLKEGSEGPEMQIIFPDKHLTLHKSNELNTNFEKAFRDNDLIEPFAISKNVIFPHSFIRYCEGIRPEIKNTNDIFGNNWRQFNIVEIYADWLSEQTGRKYRSPTMEELNYIKQKPGFKDNSSPILNILNSDLIKNTNDLELLKNIELLELNSDYKNNQDSLDNLIIKLNFLKTKLKETQLDKMDKFEIFKLYMSGKLSLGLPEVMEVIIIVCDL